MKKILLTASILTLAGCAATGSQYRANTYQPSQVNTAQAASTIEIMVIMPAKVAVDNSEQKQAVGTAASIGLGLAGGLASSLAGGFGPLGSIAMGAVGAGVGQAVGEAVPGNVEVDGVSLVYVTDQGAQMSSTQVGLPCEFHPGKAILITTGGRETRVQPNAQCPK